MRGFLSLGVMMFVWLNGCVFSYAQSVDPDKDVFRVLGVKDNVPLIEKVGKAEDYIFGYSFVGEDLSTRIEQLNAIVFGSGKNESLLFLVNTLEWIVYGEVQPIHRGLIQRILFLEYTLFKRAFKGSIPQRVAAMIAEVFDGQEFQVGHVTVPEKTRIRVRVLGDVHSDFDQIGKEIPFKVDQDVIVDGILVIPRGTEGRLRVIGVEASERGGKAGRIRIEILPIDTINQEKISLSFPGEMKGEDRTGVALGMSVVGGVFLGPVGLLSGLFLEGGASSLVYGSVIHVETADAVDVSGFLVGF